ncbi:uncharacterized protein LOC112505400 [Cynara cardunculus var. scolymus]|uniref:Uncharacterized protein n=1 Tax=Cynara cardunculus var. scolymus TaxID=59895 RepID=A0A103EZH8_CYNCS|nr:uncharacterized protein LOC112505400 [Cynara cardunculus var. scolymus]KVE43983.1 hypothetical protein Ccrd_023977 [Cynara cardunculus var. scolymus]
MAAPTSFLPLSATLLLLLCSTSIAIPISRTTNLMDGGSLKDSTNIHLDHVKESWKIETERMTLEVNDYPGSGANNRHTPKP